MRWIVRVGATLSLVFLIMPTIVATVLSFTTSNVPTLPLPGYSLYWYKQLRGDSIIVESIFTAMSVAVFSSVIATFLGWLGAYHEYRRTVAYPDWGILLAFVPCLLPQSVSGFALQRYLSLLHVPKGMMAVIIAHAALASPLTFFVLRAAYKQTSPHLQSAAHNLGAVRWSAIARLVVRSSVPSLLAACAMSFVLSWSESVVAWYVSGMHPTLATEIRVKISGACTPEVFAAGFVSIIAILVNLLAFMAASRLIGHSSSSLWKSRRQAL